MNMGCERVRAMQGDSTAPGLGTWVSGGILNGDSKDCKRRSTGRNQFMLDISSLRCQLDNQVEMSAVKYMKLISRASYLVATSNQESNI